MELQPITLSLIFDFWIYGIFANIISMFILFIISTIKIGRMPKDEFNKLKQFLINRSLNSRSAYPKLEFLLILLLPVYKVYLSLIALWYIIRYKGAHGIILAVQQSNKYTIFKDSDNIEPTQSSEMDTIEVLDVMKGDILVINIKSPMPIQKAQDIKASFEEILQGREVEVVILQGDIKVELLQTSKCLSEE